MSRSSWKGVYITKKFLKKCSKRIIKVWARNSAVPACLINKTVLVHNGRTFKKLTITREKIGFKFGDFVLTRVYYRKKKSIKKRIKK
jgi:ribosomal protein S19